MADLFSYTEATAPYVRGSDTSQAAAASLSKPTLTALRRKIYEHVSRCRDNGSTCDEAEAALDMRHQTCSARFKELAEMGWLRITEARRRTRSGRFACVYRAVPGVIA